MIINNDCLIHIATAKKNSSKKWHNYECRWSEILDRCAETRRTGETAAEYRAMSRDEQGRIKDVGGFFGGYLDGGIRKTGNVRFRSMATLDIDYGDSDTWENAVAAFPNAMMLYSTHKHSDEHPRFRLVLPFSRRVSADEYEPIARMIAQRIGIDLFDDSTFELARLFYWPSSSNDAPYVFRYNDGPVLNPDDVLAKYVNPMDASSWPMSSRVVEVRKHEMKKAGEPTEKPGYIGAFCRTYTIEEAIEKFLANVYDPTSTEGRYTYKEGSVAGGLVCYDHKFAFSNHATDPASRVLCNAFDLVRIHKFGSLDEGSRQADINKRPSYEAMKDFCASDSATKVEAFEEKRRQAVADFDGFEDAADDGDWYSKLEMDSKTNLPRMTIGNVRVILEHDEEMAGHLFSNEFSDYKTIRGGLPWDKHAEYWTDTDDSNLRAWLERKYRMTPQKDKVNDALNVVFKAHSFHPVRDYLDSLKWDGVPRLDRLIIDYIGAEDSELNRAMTRKQFTAAVKRIYRPGCKFDNCLIQQGPEGVGKSSIIAIMGGDWFNDSISVLDGKDSRDALRGTWLAELAELSATKRSENGQVKAFLSSCVDIYRAAYDRRETRRPRHTVFFGTTNEAYFLKGRDGNRRMWVIEILPQLRKHENWYEDLQRDRDQLWAEAKYYYEQGEELFLPRDLEDAIRKRQKDVNINSNSELTGMLEDYLERLLPDDWSRKTPLQRYDWLYGDDDPTSSRPVNQRTRFYAGEFVSECLRITPGRDDFKFKVKEINEIMRSEFSDKWKTIMGLTFGSYGRQRGWTRININPNNNDTL